MSPSMHAVSIRERSPTKSGDNRLSQINLLDLPLDIFRQIAEHLALVHRIEIEEGSSRLLVTKGLKGLSKLPTHIFTCKKWADVALPLHYIGHDRLYLSENSLASIPSSQSQIYKKLCTRLTKLAIRLQGTPSNRTAPYPFFCDSDNSDDEDSDGVESDPDSVNKPEKASEGSLERLSRSKGLLEKWNRDMADHVKTLADFIASCKMLDEVTFEALHGGKDEYTEPGWDYLDQSSVEKFVLCLPINLKYLTLDLAGADVTSGETSELAHICPAISRCLLNAEHVRLRLRHICPAIFGIESVQAQNNWENLRFEMRSDSGVCGKARMKSLILRVYNPMFPTFGRLNTFDSLVCPGFMTGKGMRISALMPLAARHFYSLEAGIQSLKVTFRDPNPGGIELFAHDCIRWNRKTLREEVFCYEDDGDQWMPWEDFSDEDMVIMPVPDPVSMAQELLRDAASG